MTSRIPLVSLRLLPLIAALALASGCSGGSGGSSSAPPPPPPVTAVPEGFWGGTQSYFNQTQTTSALAFVLGDGETRIITGTAMQFVGTQHLGTGSGTAYSLLGVAPAPFTLKMDTLTPKTSFTATVTLGTDPTVFNMTIYSSGYDVPLSAATLAGTFASPAAANTLSQNLGLTLTADGAFNAATAGGDTLVGTFTIPDATKSAVKTSFVFTPAGGAPEAMTGIAAYAPDTGQKVPSFTLVASGTAKTIVAKFGRF